MIKIGLFNLRRSNEEYVINESDFISILTLGKSDSLYIEEVAKNKAIDMISSTIAKCKIQIVSKDKKTELDYKLNVKPNENILSTSFWKETVTKMLNDSEALIVKIGENLYIADSFNKDDQVIKQQSFSNIKIGNMNELNSNKKMKDCIYIQNEVKTIKEYLQKYIKKQEGIYQCVVHSLQANSFQKWKLDLPTGQPIIRKIDENGETKDIPLEKYKESITKGLLDNQDTIVSLGEGFDLTSLKDNKSNSNNKVISEIIELKNDISNDVAKAFNIPIDLFNGKSSEKSNDYENYINFAVEPIMSMIEDSLNATLLEQAELENGAYIQFDRQHLRYVNMINNATALDKLIGMGFTLNEVKQALRMPISDDEFSNTRNMTKNYGQQDNNETNLKGGE